MTLPDFNYLLAKLDAAPFQEHPFRHIEINDFFSPEHFEAITNDPQIKLPVAADDRDLLRSMDAAGYRKIYFPGTTGDVERYLDWHENKSGSIDNNDTCETFGIVMRIEQFNEGSILPALNDFFRSSAFLERAADKFGISMSAVTADAGIQKYLDGYEISPHPDTRRKALTWMTNINPGANAEALDIHTHYMVFRPDFAYVKDVWAERSRVDRAWVPWSWCETVKRQPQNNSIVLFAPSNDTLHAVKATYDHLPTQRTQLYGNLWFSGKMDLEKPEWRDLLAMKPQHADAI